MARLTPLQALRARLARAKAVETPSARPSRPVARPARPAARPARPAARPARPTIKQRLERQAAGDAEARNRKRFEAAKSAAKFSKADRGRIVFISTKGKKRSGAKTPGFYVTVTAKGKVRAIRPGGRQPGPKPRAQIDIPEGRLSKRLRALRDRESLRDPGGNKMVWGRGKVRPVKGQSKRVAMGPGSKYQKKLVRSLAKAFKQRGSSRRSFNVRVQWVVRLPDGTTKTVEAILPISRADHVEIKKSGLAGWVNQKSLGALGRQLEYFGLITRGSVNHIRNAEDYDGEEEDELSELDVVDVESVEWEIEQI